MKKVLLLFAAACLFVSCKPPDNSTSPYQTIAWQPDGTGWTQFKTNDPSTITHTYWYIIPGSTMTTSGTMKIGVMQNSGSAMAQLGLVFGYLNANSFWVFLMQNYGAVWVGQWNGLSWQEYGAGPCSYIIQGSGKENDISLSYDGTTVNIYVNGTLETTIPAVNPYVPVVSMTGLTGSGIAFIVGVDSSESFPAVPLDTRFKQY